MGLSLVWPASGNQGLAAGDATAALLWFVSAIYYIVGAVGGITGGIWDCIVVPLLSPLISWFWPAKVSLKQAVPANSTEKPAAPASSNQSDAVTILNTESGPTGKGTTESDEDEEDVAQPKDDFGDDAVLAVGTQEDLNQAFASASDRAYASVDEESWMSTSPPPHRYSSDELSPAVPTVTHPSFDPSVSHAEARMAPAKAEADHVAPANVLADQAND